MSVSALTGPYATDSTSSLASLLNTAQSGSTTSVTSGSATAAASTDISQPGQLFSQLQALATSDPAKFKQVTSQMADSLNKLAAQTGGAQGQFLSKLADKFQTASQTGSASGLKPHGHHGHHGGGASSNSSSAVAAYSQSASSLDALLPSSSSSSASTTQDSVKSLFANLSAQLSA